MRPSPAPVVLCNPSPPPFRRGHQGFSIKPTVRYVYTYRTVGFATITPMSPAAVTKKGAATRAFLLQSAAEVFAERGYTETTIAELIARSGLTKGAFYFHFSSKEQLALAVIDEKQRQWVDSVQAAIKDEHGAIDQLRAVAFALVRLHRDDPTAFSVSRLTRDLTRVAHVKPLVRDHIRPCLPPLAPLLPPAHPPATLPPTTHA